MIGREGGEIDTLALAFIRRGIRQEDLGDDHSGMVAAAARGTAVGRFFL